MIVIIQSVHFRWVRWSTCTYSHIFRTLLHSDQIKNQRLAARFFGPYKILERIGQVAYKLELPADSQLLPVFHVSLLKKYVGQEVIVQTNLPTVAEDETVNLVLAEILDHRWVKQGKKIVHEVLIRWVNLLVEDATCENLLRLRQAFPTYDLEGGQGWF